MLIGQAFAEAESSYEWPRCSSRIYARPCHFSKTVAVLFHCTSRYFQSKIKNVFPAIPYGQAKQRINVVSDDHIVPQGSLLSPFFRISKKFAEYDIRN